MRQLPPMPDFAKMAALYQNDPAAFEAERQRLLREFIDSAPAHVRPGLERTMGLIETTRQDAKDPMEAVTRASALMHESSAQMTQALHTVSNEAVNIAARAYPEGPVKRTFIK